MKHLEFIECEPLKKTVFDSLAFIGGASFGVGFIVGYLTAVIMLYSVMR